MSDPGLPLSFLNFYVTLLITMLLVNLVSLFGVGYLLVLHIYLKYRGLSTFNYILS